MNDIDDSIIETFIRVCGLEGDLHELAVRSLLGNFLGCLHESQFKSGYRTEDGGLRMGRSQSSLPLSGRGSCLSFLRTPG